MRNGSRCHDRVGGGGVTGVDVEHTKAEWIANRAGDLMDNSGCTLETAYEDAAEHWDEYVDTEWLPALVAAVERVQAIAEHWSTCPKGDYDCHDCNYNRPEAGDLLLEALKLETKQ